MDDILLDDVLLDDYLAHYGVLGMKWGVRKQRPTQKTDRQQKMSTEQRKKMIRNAGIMLGTLTVAVGTVYVASRMNKKIPKDVSSKAKKVVADSFEPPTKIMHAARGKHKGFKFLKTGGISDPFITYDRLAATSIGEFTKKDGYASANILDPLGRKDRSGRVIPHTIILPKSMSADVNSVDDLMKKAWPLLKDDFASFYEEPSQRY